MHRNVTHRLIRTLLAATSAGAVLGGCGSKSDGPQRSTDTGKACEDALGGATCPSVNCTSIDPANQPVCRAGLCVDAATADEPTDDSEPTQVEQVLADFESGIEGDLVACGRIDCDVYSSLRAQDQALENPTEADLDAHQCFIDAWDSCTPAKLESFQPCIDCPSFDTTHYVVPTDDGGCKFVAFTDWSTDPLGGCKLLRDECAGVVNLGGNAAECPWLGWDDCGESATAWDNEGCGFE
jgi:hypothetical protein